MPLHWEGDGEVPVSVHRSSWTDPRAVFIGLKGGSPSANHGQMDAGSFVFDADGLRWALDLGAEGYHGIESRGMNLWSSAQDSDRWRIFRQSNQGHNTLVIDDQLQVAKGKALIVRFSDGPAFPHSVVDLSSVYAGQAQTVWRGVGLLGSNEVVIQDELTGLKAGSRVRWGVITRGEPEAMGATRLGLRQSDRSLQLLIRGVEPVSGWQVIDTARPRHEWDSPNRGTRMVAFEAQAPESGRLRWAVVLTPGSCEGSAADGFELRALAEW